jgi:hypothetical protein
LAGLVTFADSANLTTSPQPIHIHIVPAIFYASFMSGTIWYNLTLEVGTYQLKLAATLAVISESCRRETCGIVDDPEQFQVRWPETWKCPVVTGISPSLPFPQTLSGTFAGLDGHWTTPRSISSQPAPCIYDCVIAAGSSAVSLSEHKKINQTFRQIYNRFSI